MGIASSTHPTRYAASVISGLLIRHRHGERHDITATLGLADLWRTKALDFVDTDDRVHRDKAAYHAVKLRLELFFAGVDDHLSAFAEDELLHFQKAPQIALKDLLGIHFVYLTLVEENHLVDGFALAHGYAVRTDRLIKRARIIA